MVINMKALIATNEQRETGYRVAEVVPQETFHADMPLFWIDCSDEIVADRYWFNPENNQFVKFPEPETTQPQTQGTQDL
jgi:hypothetical protein